MDPTLVWNAVRHSWWLLVSGLLIGLALAGVLIGTATPLYSSSTRLFVSVAGADSSAAYQNNLFSQERVTSYAELLSGTQLAGEVVDELDLDLTPAEVADEVTATAIPQTVILDVTVTDVSPTRARDIAASLGRHLIRRVNALETPDGSVTSSVTVSIVQPAEVDPEPVSPAIERNLALGGVVGLLLGFAVALVRTRLDNTLKDDDDVRAAAGTGLIGRVVDEPRLPGEHVVTGLDEHSNAAESFRAIRTSLQFLNVDRPPKVIVVSSPVAGEGKTTLAVNLSVALAQAGSRVTLLEADLRRPRVMRYLGLIEGPGLSNVLAGKADLDEVIQRWGDGKLGVLAAGPMPPNPSELLGSAQMRALLDTLRDSNDYVSIDSPPLLPVTDGAVLSVLGDGCVITARYGVTRRDQLEAAAQVLAGIDATLFGVVLNAVPATAGTAYGYGYTADQRRRRPAAVAVPRWGRRTRVVARSAAGGGGG
jgi:receptor protein-tyrosine kinase